MAISGILVGSNLTKCYRDHIGGAISTFEDIILICFRSVAQDWLVLQFSFSVVATFSCPLASFKP